MFDFLLLFPSHWCISVNSEHPPFGFWNTNYRSLDCAVIHYNSDQIDQGIFYKICLSFLVLPKFQLQTLSERPLHNTLHQAPKQALSLGLFDFKLICQANTKHCTYQQVARARFFLAIQTYQLFTQHTDTITQKRWTKAKFHRRQQLCRD